MKPNSLFISSGVYDVRLIVKDANGCPDTAISQVRVLGYAGALNYPVTSGCVPLTVNFTALLTNVPKLVWDFSDGDTSVATSATTTHTYKFPGAFVPKLVFYDSKGCSASSTGLDTIKVDAVEPGFKVLPPCEKTPLTLVDTSHSYFSPLTSWVWNFGGGQIATGPTVNRVYPSPGQYPVKLIVTNSRGCTDTLIKDITIYPLPIITASADTAVCIPDGVPLSAKGGVSYTWSPGVSLSCTTCLSPIASPTVPTAYTVIGTDSNGCANRDTVKIGIQAKTTFNVVTGGEICLGQSFQLSAGGATVFHWTPEATLNNADTSSPIATPTSTTTYIATGKEGSCLTDTHTVKVVVNPLPTIDAGRNEVVVAGNSVQLQASGTGVDHIEWKADSALSCFNCYAPFAAPRQTTTFHLTAYTAKGCTATDSVTVKVLCDKSQLFIPNTFTPNGDGLNDYFFPRGKGINVVNSFRVYSRWGELLFQKDAMPVNDEYAGWNGTYKGQKLAPDVYVYIIEAACDDGNPIMWKGDVTLMR
jgi:gliding motility-associated-like protein